MIIKRPIITEKSMKLAQTGLYTFEVERSANKQDIAKKIADKFGVDVLKVKTINVKGEIKSQRKVRKYYQTSGLKKAMIQLKKGQKIALFETPKEEEITVTTAEGEPVTRNEKKGILGRTKVKVETGATGAAPTTQRKVITGK